VVSLFLGLAILVTIGLIVYLTVTPKAGDKFTEFYILGFGGKAEGYPKELTLGEKAKVIVGIVNHEYQNLSYRLEIAINGVSNKTVNSIVLAHKEKWENEVSFIPTKVGEKQKVEFLLYRTGQEEPCRKLHLWINVRSN